MNLQELINNVNLRNLVFGLIVVVVILCVWNCYLTSKLQIVEGMTGDSDPVSQSNLTAIRNLGNLVTKINGAISIDSDKNVTFSKNVNVDGKITTGGNLTVTGALTVTGDAEIGPAFIGKYNNSAVYAQFSHKDKKNGNSYAFMHRDNGETLINTTQDFITIRKDNDSRKGKLELALLKPNLPDVTWSEWGDMNADFIGSGGKSGEIGFANRTDESKMPMLITRTPSQGGKIVYFGIHGTNEYHGIK